MNRGQVRLALTRIRQARRQWSTAKAKFESDVDAAMTRLILEAAANHMSAEDVASYSGYTVRAIRIKMRQSEVTGRGKTLIAKQAAHVLEQNAAILGIEVQDMDLLSPLAYLPGGEGLRKAATTRVSTAEDVFPETDIVCTVPGCNCDIEYRARQA